MHAPGEASVMQDVGPFAVGRSKSKPGAEDDPGWEKMQGTSMPRKTGIAENSSPEQPLGSPRRNCLPSRLGARYLFLPLLIGLCLPPAPALALQISPMSASLTTLLHHLFLVYPDATAKLPLSPSTENAIPENKDIETPVKVWATYSKKKNCDIENFSNACRDYTLYFVIAEPDIAAAWFGFMAGPTHSIRIVSISSAVGGSKRDRPCVAITLEERTPAKSENSPDNYWLYKSRQVCVSPYGFVKNFSAVREPARK